MKKHNILIGSDPELFMVRGKKPRSAHGVIPGTKENPHPVDNGAVQVDGMALEFNINPAETEDEFVGNLNSVMATLGNMIPKGHKLEALPTAHFSNWYMKRQPKEAKELGCEPDFNAWEGGAVNPRPNADVNFRTGAGHIHIGWTKDQDINHPDHIEACCILTRELDVFLGMASLLYDKDAERRTLYGAAGAFRPKPYGCEYRVLSNAWLKDERLMRWVFNQVHHCWNRLMAGKRLANGEIGRIARRELGQAKPDLNNIKWLMEWQGVTPPPKV